MHLSVSVLAGGGVQFAVYGPCQRSGGSLEARKRISSSESSTRASLEMVCVEGSPNNMSSKSLVSMAKCQIAYVNSKVVQTARISPTRLVNDQIDAAGRCFDESEVVEKIEGRGPVREAGTTCAATPTR